MSMRHEYTSTTIWILPFLQHLDPRNQSMSKEPPPLRQSKWGLNPEKSLIQESEKCIVMNANDSGGWSGGTGICDCATLFCKCSHFENCTFLEICQSSPPGFWLYSFSHPLTWFLFYPGEVGQLAQTSGVCSFAGRAHSGFSHKPLNSTVSISK